ncbi:MAG TPA: hypothetical protein PK385_04955 [Spirochaetota bacterium]|nr:hypothetical protein [Spirochaetota bacterium]HOS32047.1 hypothetical protein [Spirochaetota bacterium]HOS55389.1 hypothetical protein [Spirochaetota bacterium]HPK62996.1 hypothetical protein [Spirochaetota bacterium]HQF76837.1 hypothetical protein [Spirochaetota bacterium]
MKTLLMQAVLLIVGAALILTRRYWGKPSAVVAAGIFFINLFCVTMVLGHDIKIWSFIRNSLIGNIFMISVILINLIAVVVLALFGK